MKYLFTILISFLLIKYIITQCYTVDPPKATTCEKHETKKQRCCFVEFRTNKNDTYRKLCVPVNKDEIKSGHHEETMIKIESGLYNGSNWNEEIMANFKDFASIHTFDCKSNFLAHSLTFISLLIIFFI